MKDWTRKRKIDFIIGVALQIYLLFPWIQHYTIYGYLYNVLKMNDYVQMYNETILPSLRESWNYTKMTAFVFLIIIILAKAIDDGVVRLKIKLQIKVINSVLVVFMNWFPFLVAWQSF